VFERRSQDRLDTVGEREDERRKRREEEERRRRTRVKSNNPNTEGGEQTAKDKKTRIERQKAKDRKYKAKMAMDSDKQLDNH
jgi:hypothetical protein